MTYFAGVKFQFGFQEGAFLKLTSFRAEDIRGFDPDEPILLEYTWDEHRIYDPHRSITVVLIVCLVATILIIQKTALDGVKGAFKSHVVVQHERAD